MSEVFAGILNLFDEEYCSLGFRIIDFRKLNIKYKFSRSPN